LLYGLFRKKLKHYNKDVKYSRVTGSFAGVGGGGTAGMIAFGTIMGGAGAALTGGNFWQGAVTGLVVSSLNHAMHNMGSYDNLEKEDPKQPRPLTYKERLSRTGLIYEDNSIFEWFAMGKVADAGYVGLKGLFSAETKILVQFGKVGNQVSHAFRHTEKMGLTTSAVKSAVLKDIPRISNNVTYGGKTIYTQITVGGQDIIYSAHRLQNGTINVGRITGLTK